MNRILSRQNISSPEKLTGYEWYKWNKGKKAETELKKKKTEQENCFKNRRKISTFTRLFYSKTMIWLHQPKESAYICLH